MRHLYTLGLSLMASLRILSFEATVNGMGWWS